MLAAALAARGHTVIDQSANPAYQRIDVDFTVLRDGKETTLEVKNDLRSETTGNVFIETYCRSNVSRTGDGWYYYCQADYLAFVQEERRIAHIITRNDLIALVNTGNYSKRTNSNGSTIGYIIPVNDIKQCRSYCGIIL